ncbi:MAG: hypothetical protein KBH01_05765 [Breznakibacter sp.]|nr:hypothetical protein [Breznakibacter sp.]
MRVTLFKMPRHRIFHHVPIYYDEAKEKQAERLKNAKEDLGLLSDEEKLAAVGSRIKGGMRRKRNDFFEQSYSERKKSNLRLIAIIVALGAIAYFLMGEYREEIFKLFLK